MHDAWKLGRDMLLSPGRAVERLKSEGGLWAGLKVYAVFLAASVLYYSYKPMNFPFDSELGMTYGSLTEDVYKGPAFWAKVQAWSPFLTAVWALFLAWFARFLRRTATSGGGPRRLILGIVLGLLPLLPLALFRIHAMPGWAFVLVWLAMLAGMAPLLRGRSAGSWRSLVSLTLALSAVNLALAPFFAATVALRWATGHHGLELVMLFWTLGLGAFILGKLEDLPTARAFMAIFLAMLCQMWTVFSLYLLGAVPKDILQALMSV